MDRKRIVFLILSLAILLPVAAGTLAYGRAKRDGDDSFYKHLSVFTEVLSLIRRSYVEETSLPQLFAGALDGAVDALDPTATYVPAEHAEEYLKTDRMMAESGLTLARERGICYVVAVADASPAATAGIQHGDVVAEVDGQSTRTMPLWRVQALLNREEQAETHQLQILRRGQEVGIELPRVAFTPEGPSVAVHSDVPVVRVPHFHDGTATALAEQLRLPVVAAADRLLVDLRGVAGGSVDVAYEAATLFAQGSLGKLINRSGETLEEFVNEAGTPLWKGRIGVLTDGGTQGAAEAFAAVLQQNAAEIVGQRTFGHAGREATQSLGDGSLLAYTDAYYTGPDGERLNAGLVPDLAVNEGSRQHDEGELSIPELTLRRALERLTEEAEEREAA